MSRLIYSSEKHGCGATIVLDSGDACLISVAQAGVLVRSYKQGFLSNLLGSFFGAKLYEEKNVYKAARTAQALSVAFPPVAELKFKNPVLQAFSSAVWSCSSPAEVAIALNEISERALRPDPE
ncbi:MAG TPA: hypothetical protein VFB02_16420 [Bradyrhizobium sp.]|nr:hypothetical protein [Bradyrhizobium sp.]